MLVFFVFRVFSTPIDFNFADYQSSDRKYKQKPLFAICYSSNCAGCDGIKEFTENFINSKEGNRSDVFISLVNCDDGSCSLFPIKGTPEYVLAIGTQPRYFPSISQRDEKVWTEFLDFYLSENLTEIQNKKEYERVKQKTKNGGTLFVLETKHRNSKMIQRLGVVSKFYKIYGATFAVYFDDKIEEEHVYAYRTPTCRFEYKPSLFGLSHFLNRNKWSNNHYISYDDWLSEVRKQKTTVYVTSETNLDSENNPLFYITQKDIDKNGQNQNHIFGWMTSGNGDDENDSDGQKIADIAGLKPWELPAILTVDARKKCAYLSKDNYTADSKCEERFLGLIEEVKNEEFNFVIEDNVLAIFVAGGLVIVVAFIVFYLIPSQKKLKKE